MALLYQPVHGRRYQPFHGPNNVGAADPDIEVETQLEPVTGAQLTTMLGFGVEGVWKHLWGFNDTASPVQPSIGLGIMTTVQGSPTYGAAGPLDSFDKAIASTDGAAISIATGNGIVTFGSQDFAVLFEFRATALPAANRFIIGHDGTEDVWFQYLTNGNVRGVIVGGTIGSVFPTVAQNHNNGISNTFLLTAINGGNCKLTSNLGNSGNVSIAAEAAFDLTSVWRAWAGNGPPGSISLCAIAISDGTAAQDTAISDLHTNATTAVANYRTATGR